MITVESVLTKLYKSAFVAGATASGGPIAGASAAGYVNSPIGNAAIEKAVTFTVGDSGANTANLATGGFVMSPTLAMIGEAGPEMVIPLAKVPRTRSRAARASDKILSSAFKEANARLRKKNGQLKKGKTQADVARMAHRLRKKMGTKKGQVRKTARRAFERR